LLTIQLNRPTRYNALTRSMYSSITDALQSSASNEAVKAVLLKSSGRMFSSGNDLAMFSAASGQDFEELAEDGARLLERFVDAFIVYPKPVVAAVQGPAMGIAVTTLALCDLVYVSEAATFHTPFTALGQSPEACSSLLFPRIMGSARANAMLLLGEKMTARDAVHSGFATDAFGIDEFDKKVKQKVEYVFGRSRLQRVLHFGCSWVILYFVRRLLLSRYPNSMKKSKALIRSPAWIAELQEANRRECDVLKKLWLGSECMDAIMKFESRRK
jgi:Delta3-Delta2-enoyl-CoA isomerase